MEADRVAFFDSRPYDVTSFDSIRPPDWQFTYYREHLSSSTAGLAAGYRAVCVFVNDRLDAAAVDALARGGTEIVALRCSGYNNVDLEAARGRLKIVRVPAYSPYSVAEHAVALMLSLNRKTHRAYYRIRDNNFAINGLLGFELHGKTAGIVGTGRIGSVIVGILGGFGMEVLAYDTVPQPLLAESVGFRYVELDELYRQSDIVSLHCPLTPGTRHLINRASLALMKPTVMIINTSRGSLIDTQALIEALKEERIGFAGLDVYEEEADYFFEDLSGSTIADDVLARLMTFSNVLITSHQAYFTAEALSTIAATTVENLSAHFAGRPAVNEVTA